MPCLHWKSVEERNFDGDFFFNRPRITLPSGSPWHSLFLEGLGNGAFPGMQFEMGTRRARSRRKRGAWGVIRDSSLPIFLRSTLRRATRRFRLKRPPSFFLFLPPPTTAHGERGFALSLSFSLFLISPPQYPKPPPPPPTPKSQTSSRSPTCTSSPRGASMASSPTSSTPRRSPSCAAGRSRGRPRAPSGPRAAASARGTCRTSRTGARCSASSRSSKVEAGAATRAKGASGELLLLPLGR